MSCSNPFLSQSGATPIPRQAMTNMKPLEHLRGPGGTHDHHVGGPGLSLGSTLAGTAYLFALTRPGA
jgi:hypothetical protein